jgi:hypothetical protein
MADVGRRGNERLVSLSSLTFLVCVPELRLLILRSHSPAPKGHSLFLNSIGMFRVVADGQRESAH